MELLHLKKGADHRTNKLGDVSNIESPTLAADFQLIDIRPSKKQCLNLIGSDVEGDGAEGVVWVEFEGGDGAVVEVVGDATVNYERCVSTSRLDLEQMSEPAGGDDPSRRRPHGGADHVTHHVRHATFLWSEHQRVVVVFGHAPYQLLIGQF